MTSTDTFDSCHVATSSIASDESVDGSTEISDDQPTTPGKKLAILTGCISKTAVINSKSDSLMHDCIWSFYGLIDHVCFVVHGMGQQWEGTGRFVENSSLRRTCEETALEEFIDKSLNVEWIGVEWHSVLHGLDTVDRRIKTITLPTCSILRQINNNILADVLYYFTSFHGQTLVDIVTKSLNAAHAAFMKKYPDFKGKVALVCHSLGGIITYDILAHQPGAPWEHWRQQQKQRSHKYSAPVSKQTPDAHQLQDESKVLRSISPANDKIQKNSQYSSQVAGSHHETHFEIIYPRLDFTPALLFTLGSPLPAVLVMRGQSLHHYRISKKIKFLNIFHLYDPMAYRMEPLLDERYIEISPVLLERPSSNRAFQLSYYQELISAYLPDLSAMRSGVRVPTFADLPSIPYMNVTGSLPSLTLPTFSSLALPNVSLPTINLPLPVLPSIPALTRAREQLSVMYDSMVSNWAGEEDLSLTSHKRKRSFGETCASEDDDDQKRSEFRNSDEPKSPCHKKQLVEKAANGSVVWRQSLAKNDSKTDVQVIEHDEMEQNTSDQCDTAHEDDVCSKTETEHTLFRFIRTPISKLGRDPSKASSLTQCHDDNDQSHISSEVFPQSEKQPMVTLTEQSAINASAPSQSTFTFTAAVEDFTDMLRRSFSSSSTLSPTLPKTSPICASTPLQHQPVSEKAIPITQSQHDCADTADKCNQSHATEAFFEPQPISPKRLSKSAQTKAHRATTVISNVRKMGDKLTAELVAAAKQTQRTMELESGVEDGSDILPESNIDSEGGNDEIDGAESDHCEDTLKDATSQRHALNSHTKRKYVPAERLDFFVQETVIDNMVHQYLVGMKAHFGYWTSKDMMYRVLKELDSTPN
ncbi:hypothetical protein BATDEDRAFT_86649 [Batrachochytrium dendrobatidis JAM81]|uniref:DDHD domain-containing protein n=2 Tax=Batrachochytrium dendrobatidis TaxID=109871 RepID=F4NWE4_BATDJ|nr:uncharacterized protein BATDEDRAFT_86649 [Batrachochytrium dendrobatidis JAM81]EGF82464.1 hypothetical protein BATDEDRAFT_86649 [Batrachochytrium dendrobatidis JAM81]|eukprot:XP_006676932.1 hypothetical protein BATDEDRAFT_86649 [Batrachochytrium dendrobatidis JAM81]